MKILLIDNGTDLLPKLQKLVPGEVVTKKFGDIKAEDAKDFDLVVLSGGGNHNILFEHEAFNEEIAMMRMGKPIIGICFGCELIAFAFDGELIELPEEQKGIYDVEVLDESLGVGVIKVYEGHRWAISKLPEDFLLLAKSERCQEIIKHKTLPIYGLQFHPENMVDETQGDELFLKLLTQF